MHFKVYETKFNNIFVEYSDTVYVDKNELFIY